MHHVRYAVCGVIAVFTMTHAVARAEAPPATQPVSPTTSPAAMLTPGDFGRSLVVDGLTRSYLIHVPPGYDPQRPTPVVLAFHGAFMNAPLMQSFSGLNKKSDQAGFVVVYPNGLGFGDAVLFFNASAPTGSEGPPDDVKFTSRLLDDLATVVRVDPKRVFAAGMSNGGMMCHRLASELSDRIAAIAPVAGTLALPQLHPSRPVPVIMFHGTADGVVPFNGPTRRTPPTMHFQSVPSTLKAWIDADGCPAEPVVTEIQSGENGDMQVTRKTYGPGKDGSEVALIQVAGAGHTWPGRQPPVNFIGKSTKTVSANDLMWEFFQKHPMP